MKVQYTYFLEYALSDLTCAYTQNSNNSVSFKLMRRGPLDHIKKYRTLPTVLEAIYRLDYTEFFFSTPLDEAQESHFVFPTIEKRSLKQMQPVLRIRWIRMILGLPRIRIKKKKKKP
jgi:hypothetical protein